MSITIKNLARTICFITFITFINSAQAAHVLIVTWHDQILSEEVFKTRLSELVPNVKFTHINANRDKSKLAAALRQSDLSKVDLIYSFGTNATKIVQTFNSERRPHVFNIVTAPVQSDIVDSFEKPGRNITGASYLVDFNTQLQILDRLKKYKRLGIWFDPREKQSLGVLKIIKDIVTKQGKTIVPIRIIPDSKMFKEMLASAVKLSRKVDAVYLISTSSFNEHYGKMLSGLDPGLVVMGASPSHVASGATVALGTDFGERGRTVAEQAAKILAGTDAGKIPVAPVSREKATLFVNRKGMVSANLQAIDKLGMKIKIISTLRFD